MSRIEIMPKLMAMNIYMMTLHNLIINQEIGNPWEMFKNLIPQIDQGVI